MTELIASYEALDAAAKQCIETVYENPDGLAEAIQNLANARCDVFTARDRLATKGETE